MFSSQGLYMTQPMNSWKLFDNPCQMEYGGFSMEICDILKGLKSYQNDFFMTFILRNKRIESENW